jgi:hypothetical protein
LLEIDFDALADGPRWMQLDVQLVLLSLVTWMLFWMSLTHISLLLLILRRRAVYGFATDVADGLV